MRVDAKNKQRRREITCFLRMNLEDRSFVILTMGVSQSCISAGVFHDFLASKILR